MKKFIAILFFLAGIQTGFSQMQDADAVLQKIAAEKNDDTRVDLLLDFFGATQDSDPLLDMQNAQKLLLQSQKNNDKISEAFALGEMGYNYWSFGNTVKHLEYDLKALSVAEETGNKKVIALSKNFLAHNYSFTSSIDFRKAVDLYRESEQAAIEGKSQILQSWAMMNLAQTFYLMGKPDSALMYTQRTYELITRINYTQYLSYVLGQFGNLHAEMGNAELAVNYYRLAINEAVKASSPRFLGDGYTKLAMYYKKANKADSVIVYAKKAITSVHNTAYEYLVSIEPSKLLLDIYRNKNSDSAMKYSELYRIANDSLYNSRNIQQAQSLTFENDLHQQEVKTEKLKTEQQRRQNIQYALIGLGIITFIILFLMLSRRHITNTKLIQFLGVVALLLVFEFLNLLLHPFLESITHHSPVLLLLALVCIAALLVPLHHKLETWTIHKLVEKNKQVRLAAAKRTIEELESKN